MSLSFWFRDFVKQTPKMKFTNMVLAASAAGMAVAYPSAREVVPAGREINTSKRSVEKRANGFTCKTSCSLLDPGSTPRLIDLQTHMLD